MRINKVICDGCGIEMAGRGEPYTQIRLHIDKVLANGNAFLSATKQLHVCNNCNYYEAVEKWAKNYD